MLSDESGDSVAGSGGAGLRAGLCVAWQVSDGGGELGVRVAGRGVQYRYDDFALYVAELGGVERPDGDSGEAVAYLTPPGPRWGGG